MPNSRFPAFSLKNLTDTQKCVWVMRYRYGWRLRQIAMELGTSVPNVSQILRRAQLSAGLPRKAYFGVIRTRPTRARAYYLSRVFESEHPSG